MKIPKIFNFKNVQFLKIRKYPIWKIPRIRNLKSSKNLQFEEFLNFYYLQNHKIMKLQKLFNFENEQMLKILQF